MHIGKENMEKEWIENTIVEALEKIYVWLHVAGNYAATNCSQKMNIYFYWTELKKKMPTYGKSIGQINANTAFTYSCKKVTEINLFRYEEWFKVFIHETFHNMGLDFLQFSQEEVVRSILDIFPVKSDVNLFETYCETWAELVNICFMVYAETEKENIAEMIEKTQKAINYERLFSCFQCMKILHFYGLDYEDLHLKTNGAQLKRNHKYKESTNVLSYYILKSIILFFIDDFIKWCREHNGIRPSLKFGIDNDVMEYCLFIKEHYLRKEYTNVLLVLKMWFESKQSKKKSFEFILNTLRMTVFG
jgi:hypothetical protein